MPHALNNLRRGSVQDQRKASDDLGPLPFRHRPRANSYADSRSHTAPTKQMKWNWKDDLSNQTPDHLDTHDTLSLSPQMWDPEIDRLMGRTSRAYKVVINYEKDSCGGYRWCPEDIAQIREMGQDLDDDIRGLYQWHRVILQRGKDNRAMMEEVDKIAEKLRELCEGLQSLISATERKLPTELLRDDVYTLNEYDALNGSALSEDMEESK